MKVRCPYCRHIFETIKSGPCPQCGKTSLLPGYFDVSGKPAAAKEERSSARVARRFTSPPPPLLMNRPLQIALGCFLLAVAGALYVGRARKPLPSPVEEQRTLALSNLETLRVALEQMRSHIGRYPTSQEGLVCLMHDPGVRGWQGPYILELKPDPWKHQFFYISDGTNLLLYSAGPDGLPRTADDLMAPRVVPAAVAGDAGVSVEINRRPAH